MLGNITGATIGSRLVRRVGIDADGRAAGRLLMLVAGLRSARSRCSGRRIRSPSSCRCSSFMVAFMMTMPPATAGALTPFPRIAGSASSLLSFCQFVVASTAALVVGLTFDGTSRPMAITIAIASVCAFVSCRVAYRRGPRATS